MLAGGWPGAEPETDPCTVAETGQSCHCAPVVQEAGSVVRPDWLEFSARQGPLARSRNCSVPPRPRIVTQYVAPEAIWTAVSGTVFHARAASDVMAPWTSSTPG